MIPLQKVKDIISKHNNLEKELSSGKIEPKLFAKKSKEYSNLGNIISTAKEYLNFDNEKKDLEQILQDKNNDLEIIEMAKKDLMEMESRKLKFENKLTHSSPSAANQFAIVTRNQNSAESTFTSENSSRL